MDIIVENYGSLFLVRPMTKDGTVWLESNVEESAQWFGGALVVEPRYLTDLLAGAVDAGLRVS
jgi:hypothetical protein